MTRDVFYSPEARRQLTELYLWIADQSGYPDRAETYVTRIFDFCDALSLNPHVGISREDLRPGLRTVGFRRRVIIAFAVHQTSIEIHGVFYGGRDHESFLSG
ncbi:MAG: addiction module toxin RelE [Microbacterium sp. 69-10]|uniref:type II toxin-antitoxin system RelE/ParE family toxin n=1 Tax=Microbacterium sp. 69-10 TaxID=1895783 RepID=UPI00095CAFB8|nr:type II toxin-antitoxin system RelE/ParE family toxin [Microbacterium sp. 69-10]OJU38925.1 MAG: addiction module toxin RelE [Microbacterium sp. 69-10]